MSIKRIKDFPDGSGSLTNDDIFLFMDDPSTGGTTKKISLSQLADAIGGGGGVGGNPFDQELNTTDFPTFSGVGLSNGTTLAQGTFDNNTGGNNGISLNCYVGYELNWQGGHLKSTSDNGVSSSDIIVDSNLVLGSQSISTRTLPDEGGFEFEAKLENGVVKCHLYADGINYGGIDINYAGITFSDGSVQTSSIQNSNSHIICKAGDNLAAKYTSAKLLTPGGNALSATNRATLVIMPGNYTVSSLVLDASYVDVIGLGSIKLERGAKTAVRITGGLNVTASDIRVKGISTGTESFGVNGSSNQIFEDCSGGDNSFGGYYGTASGSFSNCSGGDYSFGGDGGTASGSFTNCSGGYASFGGGGTASGSFKDCTGGYYSFGGGGTASGSFTNCTGGYGSFGGDGGTASGSFTNCTGGYGSFGGDGGTASGSFTNCTGGDYSFGGFGTASGSFTNCSGGDYSFGGDGGTASGSFKDCSGGDNSFGGYYGTASGSFSNCSGGDLSFGGDGGTASGSFLYCRLTNGSFQTLSLGGKYRVCIDGNYNVINADYVAP